ncbi:MAG: diguanylate cyclase domain-containing protein [Acutalibacter sp.]|jgi:diguanylate cyclase (GGDEF)-like protein
MFLRLKSAFGKLHWAGLAFLLALELLMSFSFLGYFHVEPLSFTIAYLPVLLAGALLGPAESSLVGMAFGLASMWKASANYVMDFDKLFSPFFSGSPLESFLLSVGTRTLFGLAVGLLFRLAKRAKHTWLWIAVTAYCGIFLHSLLVYTALWLFFPHTGFLPSSAFRILVGLEHVVVNGFSTLVVLGAWLLSQSHRWQKLRLELKTAQKLRLGGNVRSLPLLLTLITLTMGCCVTVAFYFVHRMNRVLEINGFSLSSETYSDLTHLQIQFLVGIFAMIMIIIGFLILNRLHNAFKTYESSTDPLTEVLTRRAFFQTCGDSLRELTSDNAMGYFLMVDLDNFKSINDRFGHPEGDWALKEAARCLKDTFGPEAILGRMGGDEFAALLYYPLSQEELEEKLARFLKCTATQIAWEDGSHLTCSLGALPITGPCTAEELYRGADRVMYAAKKAGKNRWVIGTAEEFPPIPAT